MEPSSLDMASTGPLPIVGRSQPLGEWLRGDGCVRVPRERWMRMRIRGHDGSQCTHPCPQGQSRRHHRCPSARLEWCALHVLAQGVWCNATSTPRASGGVLPRKGHRIQPGRHTGAEGLDRAGPGKMEEDTIFGLCDLGGNCAEGEDDRRRLGLCQRGLLSR